MAKERLDKPSFDYFSGGANDQYTLNIDGYSNIFIKQRAFSHIS
jgi:isopentenyl diphosphate isomerase/L-lactate dehydrogenase-like FMN-dependent dehydrogenase